jgi:hypothetical protein
LSEASSAKKKKFYGIVPDGIQFFGLEEVFPTIYLPPPSVLVYYDDRRTPATLRQL